MPLRGEISSAIPQIQEAIGTDAQGRPVQINERYRRLLETLWERSGGFEDETFANDAQVADIIGKLTDANERLEALELSIQQDRAIDAALDDLQTRLSAIESLPTIQENADVSGQIDAIQFGLNAVEEQVFTASRGIDVVTNDDIVNNANISPDKLKVIKETQETYTTSTITNVNWNIIMKKRIGSVAQANQFFLDGTVINTANPSADGAGTFNWEAAIHLTEPTGSSDRGVGTSTTLDSGSFTISTGLASGPPTVWTPTTQFYTWRNTTVANGTGYPTDDAWIVLWGFIGSGAATEAYMNTTGLPSRIEFTSAFGISEL